MSSQPSQPPQRWSIEAAHELYGVSGWGREHFAINDLGHLTVGDPDTAIDLKELVDDLVTRGIQLPFLIRFVSLLESRIQLLNGAFQTAMSAYGYRGEYRGVFPIKVNQSRQVVKCVAKFGREFNWGLEAGSKPELVAVMAMLEDKDALVVCNGTKDRHYVETALLASRLRRSVIVVVEKPSEFAVIRAVCEELDIRPQLGLRIRLSATGSGKWAHSGGDHAKFGLSVSEILRAVGELRNWGMLDCVRLLHFHLGSQITSIRSIKNALREAGRVYTELVKLGCEALQYFDVGGGLGVDYDGSRTAFESSMNYSLQEYANDVVSEVQEACDEADVAHPTIVSESGRAIVAHHSVLVVNVMGVRSEASVEIPDPPPAGAPDLVHNLWEAYTTVSRHNLRECYHDALEYKDQMLARFNMGQLSLRDRAVCEHLFWATCRKVAQLAQMIPRRPAELRALDRVLADTYFCNFSVFQSLPDAWAINQLFPIMPIHRLDERPTRRGILADNTCDSDGIIEAFIDPRAVISTLPLHELDDEPYYLAFMLTGAYQEILGDMHNLFGDTHVVSVSLGADGRYVVDEVVYGDTVSDVLRYVDYRPNELTDSLRAQVELAVRTEQMTLAESRQLMQRYREALCAYTYLE